jgi:hypothetical protein
MSVAVKILLAIVAAVVLFSILYTVVSSLFAYALIALGVIGVLALLWRWLAGRGGASAPFRLARAVTEPKRRDKRAARDLQKLERKLAKPRPEE